MARSLDPRSQEKHSLKAKIEQNIWDHLDDFFKVFEAMQKGEWSWTKNIGCKYVNLRIDMRDGGCVISAEGERITPEQLAWQYSKEKPKPPEG